MNNNETAKLTHIIQRHSTLAAEIKERKMEQKELEDGAWEQCGKSAKCVRQLSKESKWDAVKREQQRQLEEEIDQCRAALGLLSDLPLGQVELDRMGADEPQHHATNPKYKVKEHKGKRRRQPAAEATA
jgi:hypothetical protein